MESVVSIIVAALSGLTVVAYRHPGSYGLIVGPLCQCIIGLAMSVTLAFSDFGYIERSQTMLPLVCLMGSICYLALLFFLHRLLAVGEDRQ